MMCIVKASLDVKANISAAGVTSRITSIQGEILQSAAVQENSRGSWNSRVLGLITFHVLRSDKTTHSHFFFVCVLN